MCICGLTKLARIPLSLDIPQEGTILKNPLVQWAQIRNTDALDLLKNSNEKLVRADLKMRGK